MRHSFSHVMYFIIVFMCRGQFTFTICFKISLHACGPFGGYLLHVLPVHFRFLEPTWQLTLKMDSAVRGGLSFPDNDGL
jgi:hypothetical protein